jgi:DNA-binding PadR family transcriptional regulator
MSLINIIIQQNSEISAYSTKHPKEIGEELKRMVEKGWLVSEGKGHGMKYRLRQKLPQGGQVGGQVESEGGQVDYSLQGDIDITVSEWHILQHLREGAKSSGELKIAMNKEKALSGAFKEKLASLREKELIEYTIPEKPKSSKQKYRLTELGKIVLVCGLKKL